MKPYKKFDSPAHKALFRTVTKMVPAVFTAIVATTLGFIALYTSPVPMIKDFGKMLTIGVGISFFVGVLILIPLLFTRDHFFSKPNTTSQTKPRAKRPGKPSKFEKFLGGLTKRAVTLRWLIILLALVTSGMGIWVDLGAKAETDIENFMPQNLQALKDIHKLRDVVGTTDHVSIMYEGKDVLSPESLDWTEHITKGLEKEFPDVVVDSNSITKVLKQMNDGNIPEESALKKTMADIPNEQRKLLVNESATKGVITVGIKHLEAEPLKSFIGDLEQYLHENQPVGMKTTVTGKSVLDVEMVSALTTGRLKMTLLGLALVFLGLLAMYRHPVKAFIPLLPIIFIVGWSGGIMYLAGIAYTPLTATLGALIIGIGTEFTILIMERFYEERANGRSGLNAITIANRKIGRAIIASAMTVIGGFSALLASDFVILSNFGMMTLINVSLALLSTIIVLPGILVILDRFVNTKYGKEMDAAGN